MSRGVWDGAEASVLADAWGAPGVEGYESIGSTNDRAAELAALGAPRGTIVIAEAQTRGRGRQGKTWASPARTGVWMSFVLSGTDAAPQLPLMVGVGCARAIESVAEDVVVGIEWPNDLLVGGRKVGGILCESVTGGVVVGVGINVDAPEGGFPAAVATSATALEVETAKRLSRRELGGAIFREVFRVLDAPHPFSSVAEALAGRDALRGRPVLSEQAGPGVAVEIDREGALVVERPDGDRVRVVSGSVTPSAGR